MQQQQPNQGMPAGKKPEQDEICHGFINVSRFWMFRAIRWSTCRAFLDWSKKRRYKMILSVMSMQLWNEIKKSM